MQSQGPDEPAPVPAGVSFLSAVSTIATFLVVLSAPAAVGADEPLGSGNAKTLRTDPARIQLIVDEFRERLSLPSGVQVELVQKNSLMVSVETVDDGQNGFLLSLEQGFVESLTEDELKAAIAHELGHVWIFTHHPFLQTEKLANEIAMRVVDRETLISVYEKVWQRQGTKGDLVRFVGD